ncbi:MAG TPA: cell division protein FtsZ, partial [Gammaproteobacteria bacterium]|nr:cell division protein FtsZ [Gammaproteobacteria bacterium]
AGARGILINITAGLEMSIGEFEEVGNVVREFASEDATVVIGTSLDPDSNGEMRVTVVATGLNRGAAIEQQQPQQSLEIVSTGTSGPVDYTELDT